MTAKANRDDLGLSDNMYYTSWDQRHTLTLVADYKTGKFAQNIRADFGSGRADIAAPDIQERASPWFVASYNLSFALPKNSSLGSSIYLNIFNILNTRQTLRYSNDGTGRVQDSWMPGRFVSVGVSNTF